MSDRKENQFDNMTPRGGGRNYNTDIKMNNLSNIKMSEEISIASTSNRSNNNSILVEEAPKLQRALKARHVRFHFYFLIFYLFINH